jgi:predicted aminopeptidase
MSRRHPAFTCLRLASLAAAVALLGGCANLGYYVQSVRGQLDIWQRQRPLGTVIADRATPEKLRARLVTLTEIRNFASEALSLPDNASYRRYADLDRPYVVWNVFAAPEFSVKPEQWCFLFVGCVSYRGYFNEAEAERFAAGLKSAGNDVFVGGIPAYSTLGYFNDPVLNTFVYYPVVELSRLIIHELSHQVAYARDDTVFNESFAVAVEQEGVRRWLARYGTDQDRQTYETLQRRRQEFTRLILKHRGRLETLYAQKLPPEVMRTRKAEHFADMETEYQGLKAGWSGFSGFDRFFSHKANNALLVSVSLYTQLVPAFQELLARHGGDLPRFYAAVKALSRLDKDARAEEMDRLSLLAAARAGR